MAVDGEYEVARLDTGTLAGGVCRYALRLEHPVRFNPPDAVCRRLEASLLLKVEDSEQHGGNCQQGQYDGSYPYLRRPFHTEPHHPSISMIS